jgi:hypothetical protein
MLFFALLCMCPAFTSAHAFGQLYTLPLPLSYYTATAVFVLLASFIVFMFFSKPVSTPYMLRAWQLPVSRYVNQSIGIVGIFIFITSIYIAFFGSADYSQNAVPGLFWAVFLLGIAYISTVIGGLWRSLNPFEGLVRSCLRIIKRSEGIIEYPRWLGYYPALIWFFCLLWLELLSGGYAAIPAVLGGVCVGYFCISLIGSYVFGVNAWFTYADFFNVFFGFIGRCAPFQLRENGLQVVAPGENLISESPAHSSALLFILLMLSSTAFDGLQDTQIWWNILYAYPIQMNMYTVEKLFVLASSPFLFLSFFWLMVSAMKYVARLSQATTTLMLRYAYSLIPIAIAYNVAHYFTFLVNEVQLLAAQLSDPLGRGWDLFGTVHHKVNIGLIGAETVWYIQCWAIVVGHVFATYVAHRITIKECSTQRQVLLAQIPMLILMVCYTIFGLWILSQGYKNG